MDALAVLTLVRAEQQSAWASSPREQDQAYLEHLGPRVRVLRSARQFAQDQLADLAGPGHLPQPAGVLGARPSPC